MENKALLEKVIKNRLEDSLSKDLNPEEKKQAFREAMEALDRQTEIEKAETAKTEQTSSRIVKVIEVGAIPAALLTLDYLFKSRFMRNVCEFEKDYTFTTTPGRSISSFFKFRK